MDCKVSLFIAILAVNRITMKVTEPRFSDEELVEGLKRQDPVMIQYLYQNAGPMVYKLVVNAGGDGNDAEDVFQEGILATYLNIRTGKYKLSAQARLTTYLVQICKYKWLDHVKSAYVSKNILGFDNELLPEVQNPDQDEKEDQIKMLHRCIQELGETCRRILQLFYWEKKSYDEIATQIGQTPSSAKNQKYRCMKKLKELATTV